MEITPTDTTPLSDENAPDPMGPRPAGKNAPAPKPQGALRVDVARRPPNGSAASSERKPPPRTNKDADADSGPGVKAAPKPLRAPEPVWAPEPVRKPKPTAPLGRSTEAPPRIPNWERDLASTSRPDTRWEDTPETTLPDIPVHAAPLTRRRRLRRNRAFVATVVLVCLCVAVVAVAIVSSHHSPAAPTAQPGAAPTPEVSSAAVSRVQAATDAADAATTTARSSLSDISGIPTLTTVAVIINPYVGSLQRYESTLTATGVPPSAQTTVGGVRSLVRQDVQFFSTINELPSLGLGTYLAEFNERSTQLQMAFRQVKGELSPATG